MNDVEELAGPHEQWCQDRTHGDCCAGECDCGRDERRDAIAAALAAEREKARAPFLALAEELDRQSEKADANSGSGYLTNEYARGCATAFELSADRIRDALDQS